MGMQLESNSFAPVTDEADFRSAGYFEGDEILQDLISDHPRGAAELAGFFHEMNERGIDWQPVPILNTGVEPGGPADHTFFLSTKEQMRARLLAAKPLDGVFFVAHGAMTTTESDDPDGELFQMVREVIGPDTPLIATLDLHANISQRMVAQTDILVSYVTNPHVDQYDRAIEAAQLMLEMFEGMSPQAVFIRVPMVSPTVILLTSTVSVRRTTSRRSDDTTLRSDLSVMPR